MTLTVGTSTLIGLLTDALQTAETDPEAVATGLHVATHRDDFGDEPGAVDLIAITSTDTRVAGHTFDIVNGQVVPSVWPVNAAMTVLAICKNLIKVRGKEHTVDIEVVEQVPDGEPSGDEKPDHPGYLVTVSETPALFDTDTEFQFHADHEARFPLDGIRRIILGEGSESGVKSDGSETHWNPHVLAPLAAIARRRKERIMFYRFAQHAQAVQIGDSWIGAAMPITPIAGEYSGPTITPLIRSGVAE